MPYNVGKFEENNALTDLLVITDVPRLRKVFSRLADDHHFRLRVTSSLEKGGEELVADKPAIVLVQTHLSGLSADILLMHLKKLLGRRRTRFVLLSPPDQVGEQVLKLYQGHIDSSLDDQSLSTAILEMISTLEAKKKKTVASRQTSVADSTDKKQLFDEEPLSPGSWNDDPLQRELSERTVDSPPAEPAGGTPEPTLEEQGLVYAPRPSIQVYSEFTSTFDTAVDSMAAPESPYESPSNQANAGMYAQDEVNGPARAKQRLKLFSFLLWLVPVVVIVVVVTILQYRGIQPTSIDVATNRPAVRVVKPTVAVSVPLEPKKTVSAPISSSRKPVSKSSAAGPDARMGDRADLSAIANNRAAKAPVPIPVASVKKHPITLPAFIPRAGLDKAYSTANPGCERYKGVVTEFKIFREGEYIKAIQVIDRGGRGVPDAFMKAVLQQLAKAPSYAVASSEKKNGYEIQRGQVADNLKVVYYRDADGGRLRAFVVTWQ